MSLTDAEIEEFEQLLHEVEVDKHFERLEEYDKYTSPNYSFLRDSILNQKWGVDEEGRPTLDEGVVGCALEGSSRSTKTWAGVDLIIWLGTIKHKDKAK